MPAGVAVARDLVGPATEAAINRLSPRVRRVAAYHYGLADAQGNPVREGSGKALRPALALLSARAAGVSAERGVSAAVAVELVHNFSLLHDDIMDGDTERRHRPTAWTVFGVGPGLLAGGAPLALGPDPLPGPCSGSGRPSWPATPCWRWPRTCCWRTAARRVCGPPAACRWRSS